VKKIANKPLTSRHARGRLRGKGASDAGVERPEDWTPEDLPDSPDVWTHVAKQLGFPWQVANVEYRTFTDRHGVRIIGFRAARSDTAARVAELTKRLDAMVDDLNYGPEELDGPDPD